MHTTSQVKAAPAAQPSIAKPAAQPLMASAVETVEAPSLAEQMARARLGHSFGAISVLPPDPPSIQPKRMVESAQRLSAFRPMGQGRVNPAPVIPAGWSVPSRVQTKLTVGEPNDPYEQEADRVADQVMRMAEPCVQAKCACGGEAGPDGECAACKAQRMTIQRQVQDEPAEEESVVQAQSDTAPVEAAPDLESRLNGSRGSGQALPADTRSSMESAFGVDFGGVRVHTGNEAVQMNKELSAQAFTHGSDIYFNAGKYEPGSAEGKGLLAHELTHVVQQQQSAVLNPNETVYKAQAEGFSRGPSPQGVSTLSQAALDVGISKLNELPVRGRVTVQRQHHDETPAADDSAVVPVEVNANSFDECVTIAATFLRDDMRSAMRIVVTDGHSVRVYNGNGQPVTRMLTFREPRALPPGLYTPVRGQDALHRVYHHRDGTVFIDPDSAGIPPVAGRPVGDFVIDQQLNEQDRQTYTAAVQGHDGVVVIPGTFGGTSEQIPAGAGTAAEGDRDGADNAPPRRSRPRPADPDSQFSGGSLSANLPAFPAQILGPDMQPSGGVGSYRMQLNFNAYDPTMLGGVAEAMRYVDYHWERIPIPDEMIERSRHTAETELRQSQPQSSATAADTREQLRTQARRGQVAGGSTVSRAEGSDYRHAEIGRERTEDLATVEQNNIIVRRLLQNEIEISAGWRQLMAYATDLGEVMGEDSSERDIPWPQRQGWYIIRCVAQPESSGEYRRAASVQTKLVEVRAPRRLAQEELDRPGADLRQRNADIRQLEAQRDNLPENDSRRSAFDARIALLRRRYTRAELRATGDLRQMLNAELADARTIKHLMLRLTEESLSDQQMAEIRTQLDDLDANTRNVQAISRSGAAVRFILRHELWAVDDRISRLGEQIELIGDRGREMTGSVIRPQAVFTSRVTGQTFPLLLQIGPAADRQGAAFAYRVSDVTTPDGRTGHGTGATEAQAATNALADFARQNEYGRGLLVIRMPGDVQLRLTRSEFDNRPGDVAIARARIGDVVAALAAIGLLVSGVGAVATAGGTVLAGGAVAAETATGTAAALIGVGSTLSTASTVLGTASGILGAVQGGDNLIRRWRGHTLHLDASSINDLLAVLGGLAQGVSMIGNRVRVVTSSRFFTLVDTGVGAERIATAERALQRAITFVDAMRRVENLIGDVGFVWGNLMTLNQLMEINAAEERGDLTHAAAAGQRASIIAGAIPGAIQFAVGVAHRITAPDTVGPDLTQRPRRPAESSAAPDEPHTPTPVPALVEDPRSAPTDRAAPIDGSPSTQGSGERTMAGTGPSRPSSAQPGPVDAARAARLATHERFVASAQARLNTSRRTPPSTEPPLPRGHEVRNLTVDTAYSAYEQAVARSGDREVGLWFNPNTGEYAVTVGSPHSVRSPSGEGWQGTLHLHRNPENVLTYRNPAPADVWNTLLAAFRNNRPTTEFVESTMPDGSRRTTAVTVDPTTRTVTIEYQPPDGPPVNETYPSLDAYVEAYGERSRHVDPESPEYRWLLNDLDQYYSARRDTTERTAAGSAPPEGTGGEVTTAPPTHRETGQRTPEARQSLAQLLYTLQQSAAAAHPGALTPTVAAARELIRSVSDWRSGLRSVLASISHPEERALATQALIEARQTIVDYVYQRVLAHFPDVYMFNSGTVAFNSDIDITIRPIEQRADFSGTPRDSATQIRDAAAATQFFADQLRATVGGETDRVIDTNVYPYIGESSFTAEGRTPQGRAALADTNRVVGFAAQRRGQGPAAWARFRADMEARFVSDPSPEGQAAASLLRSQMAQAETYYNAREQERTAALERARLSNPGAPPDTIERVAREEIVRYKVRELAQAAAQNPPDLARIADLQSQILWFQPDAYVTRSAIDQAVTHQQGRRAAGTSGAAASSGAAATQRRRVDLERNLTSARRTLTTLEAQSPPAAAAELSAARELVQNLELAFREEVRADLASIDQTERARGLSTGQQLAHSAAAAAENLGMMTEHAHAASDDLSAQIKAVCKYGGRILLAERLTGLGTSSAATRDLIVLFTASRWGIFEGNAAPERLIAQMLINYAYANSMGGQVRHDASGHPVGVNDAVRRAFVNDLLDWAPGAVARLQIIEATTPRIE